MVRFSTAEGWRFVVSKNRKLLNTSAHARGLYNRWASGYEEAFVGHHQYSAPRHVFNAVAAAADVHRPAYKVLDVGVGTGLLSAEFRRVNGTAHLAGIDISENMLAECETKSIMNELKRGDFQTEPLPFADNSFDATVSSGVFEMLLKPETVIAEMARVTRPGGIVAFTSVAQRTWGEALAYPFVFYLYSLVGLEAGYEGKRHKPGLLTGALRKNGVALIGSEQFVGYNKVGRDTPYTLYVGRKPG